MKTFCIFLLLALQSCWCFGQVVQIPYTVSFAMDAEEAVTIQTPDGSVDLYGTEFFWQGVLNIPFGEQVTITIITPQDSQPIEDEDYFFHVVTFHADCDDCEAMEVYAGYDEEYVRVLGQTVMANMCAWPRALEVNVSVDHYTGAVRFDACSDSLPADGVSTANCWYEPGDGVSGGIALPGPISWSIPTNPANATITSTGPASARITSGTSPGTIIVRATGTNGCYVDGKLDITDEGCGCQSGSCGSKGVWAGASFSTEHGRIQGHFMLGSGAKGESQGCVILDVESPAEGITNYHPKHLTYPWAASEAHVIRDFDQEYIRQIRTPQGLMDLHLPGDVAWDPYEVRFYAATNVGALSNGLYQVFNQPVVTCEVSYPSNLYDPDYLRITEIRPDQPDVIHDFEWTGSGWQLTSGLGGANPTLRDEITSAVWTTNTYPVLTETRTILDGATVLLQSIKEYTVFPAPSGKRLTAEILGSGSDARTTSYTYYPSGMLQQVTRADGSWQIHDYDSTQRLVTTYSSFLSQEPTTNRSLCRTVDYDYSITTVQGSGDAGTWGAGRPRKEIECLLGQPVSVRYHVYLPFETRDIQGVETNAAWDSPGNLVTTNKYYSSGEFYGQLKSVQRPDGTIDIYQYRTGQQTTNIVLSGAPDAYGTNVSDGRRTVTILGPAGETISRVTTDILTQGILSRELYGEFDQFGHAQAVTNLDGTIQRTDYQDCCGLWRTTERDGTPTYYTHDALQRVLTEARNGITNRYVHDGTGKVLETWRDGTSGTSIRVSAVGYNTAGEKVVETNALGGVTQYETTFSGGERTLTTTSPDATTRVETFYRDGHLKERSGTAVHPATYAHGLDTQTGVYRPYSLQVQPNGTTTNQWIKTYVDGAGRTLKTVYADGSYTENTYNSSGQLLTTRDPDGRLTGYGYNSLGELEYTTNGTDRVSRQVTTVAGTGADAYWQTIRSTRLSGGSFLATDTNQAATAGTWSINIGAGLTNWSATYHDGQGGRWVTNGTPDGSVALSYYQAGLLQSVSRYQNDGGPLGLTSYGYDEYARLAQTVDAGLGTTTNAWDAAGRLLSVTAPGNLTTRMVHDVMGRVVTNIYPDGAAVTNRYLATGERDLTAGARTYPAAYGFDGQGRMTNLTTWQQFPSGTSAATAWAYDAYRGFLTNKLYADNTKVGYAYTNSGRLASRAWARGVKTAYGYNSAGELSHVNYDDTTPDVEYVRDEFGRLQQVIQGGVTGTLTHDDSGRLTSETFGSVVTVSNRFDTAGRRIRTEVLAGANVLFWVTNGFDAASRLQVVSDGARSATYAYLTNTSLVGSIVYAENGQTRMSTWRQYDSANRLTNIASFGGTSSASPTLASFGYGYNSAGQRTEITVGAGALASPGAWRFQYDALGQVTSGKKYWADGTIVPGQQFEYTFDEIGNRKQTRAGGDAIGYGLRSAAYTNNLLNQITGREVPGTNDFIGMAHASASVTVNGQSVYRKGEYYWKALALSNQTAAVFAAITNTASLAGVTTNLIGNSYLPRNPEIFLHDADGNLTNDGRWAYTWDGENRLVRMVSRTDTPTNSWMALAFAYDPQGRRISKVVSNWNGNAWVKMTDHRFVYDGWNLLAVLNADLTLVSTFTWGLVRSGSEQGAGGVGGLLFSHSHSNAALTASSFHAYDGNGNVVALINATNGAVSANYEYGPFGEVIRATGPLAKTNPFRWSTQYTDDETDLVHYLRRYYNPTTGRWLSRDPLEEKGGENYYGFCDNDPVGSFDTFGLWRSRAGFTEHRQLTKASFDAVITPFPVVSEQCKKKMLKILQDTNDKQDTGAYLDQLERHYNRPYVRKENATTAAANRVIWHNRYEALLGQELDQYFKHLSNGRCKPALESLGALTHFWQDYYSHAIHQTTGFSTATIAGSPDSGGGPYWPSSYAGFWIGAEHPASISAAEPFPENTPVWQVRWNAAIQFVQDKYFNYLGTWVATCRCPCDSNKL